MKLKNKTARALAVMTVVVAAPLFATAAHAQNTFAAFARGGYGYCDAKKVAAVWRNSIGQAKAVIGRKVLSGLTNLIDTDIASTRGRVRCSWADSQLSYNDAVRLARYWGRQPHEAKGKVASMMSDMGYKRFRHAMRNVLGR